MAQLTLATPARTYDEIICAAFTDDGIPIALDTAERMLSVPATLTGPAPAGLPEPVLAQVLDTRRTEIVGRAQERLGEFLNEEEERLDNWREDAKVSYDAQIKTLTKQANETRKSSRAAHELAQKVDLQRQAAALKRQADDLQHRLYTRLAEIDTERERMLDAIADQLALTPALTPLFTIRWNLT